MIRVPRNRQEWFDLADQLWRAATPTLLGVPVIALMAVPVVVPLHPWMPQLGLLTVMFWASQKPDWMPPLAAMALGLLQDVWLGSPLGMMMLVNGLVALLFSSQLKFFISRPFKTVWAVIAATCVSLAALQWLAYGLLLGQWPPVAGFASQALLTAAMAPVMFLALGACLARLLDRAPVLWLPDRP